MIKRKKFIVSVITMTLILGLIPYGIHIKPISKAAEHGLSNPRVEQDNTVTWDCIYFGNYWQNDTNGDGVADQNDDKEPIKWRVLSVNGNDALLLADKGLDAKPYDSYRGNFLWEKSILRKWLNDDFYNAAFNTHEQNEIVETVSINEMADGNNVKDKVSLLSLTDACNASYGFNSDSNIESETRRLLNTSYTNDAGARTYNGTWWLRCDRSFEGYRIYTRGEIKNFSPLFLDDSDFAVRPCLHLNLSSDTWTKADTVTATGGTFATPTPEPTPTPTPTPIPTPTPTPHPTFPITTASPTLPPTSTQVAEPSLEPKVTPPITDEPKTITAPGKVNGLSAKNKKKGSVTLSWKKVKNATGYQVQYVSNAAFAKKQVKSTKKTKLVIKKLKKKKSYSFRVRAYKISNDVKVFGNWSKAKKVKIKK